MVVDAPRWSRQLLDPIELDTGLTGLPVPGHARGTVLWHLDDHLLFSGDSLAWDPKREWLIAFRRPCRNPGDAQTDSLDRVARSASRFDRLFRGHRWNHDAPAEVLHDHLVDLVARMSACPRSAEVPAAGRPGTQVHPTPTPGRGHVPRATSATYETMAPP